MFLDIGCCCFFSKHFPIFFYYACVCACTRVCPQLNAMANRAAGKGYENEDHYTNIKLQFIGIENIHVMRNSQQKIIDSKTRLNQLPD